MINDAVKQKKIDVFSVGKVVLSHTLFADDIVCFIKGNRKSCRNLKYLVEKYCVVTGQKLNLEKSVVLYPDKCRAEVKAMVESVLKIKEGRYPLKYLGTYIAPRRLEEDYQMKLVQKGKGKVDIWANSKGYGGLGIRDLHAVKKAAMAKRILPIMNKENHVWYNLLNEKCSRWHPWMKCKGKDLTWNGKIIAESMSILKDGLKIAIGDGRDVGTKLFCDASWKGGAKASAGCILISRNNWKLIAANVFSAASPLKAEMKAIWYGLDDVRKKGLAIDIVYSDCSNAIKILNRESDCPWDLVNVMENILMVGRESGVKAWKFVNMNGNCIAHFVARLSLIQEVSGIWCSRAGFYDNVVDVNISCNELLYEFLNKFELSEEYTPVFRTGEGSTAMAQCSFYLEFE
ncbi:hypothetical protein Cni_G25030 [Canna indica]|uniref:RNase H type-1 domain-containing protein n=1 Tax=Canna indica TaxID=4628 RepID=A0AAQ3QNU1_9LILI|nr:hypothetical protein Cni_G25030 [Canna indica]